MRILWFTWKDRNHPLAGGAEVINEELAKRLVRDGHEVKFIVGGFKGGGKILKRNGLEIIRVGNRFSVYYEAYRYYKKNLIGWPEVVIEEVNTLPFFTNLYIKEVKIITFIYQLCREVWFYQIFFPLNIIGYIFEPLYLRLLSKNLTLTESQSTRKDLMRYGFSKQNIYIIPVGTDLKPIQNIKKNRKYNAFTILSLGQIRKMKRTLHQIEAFEEAKKAIPKLKLKIAGNIINSYGKKVLRKIESSPYKDDIEYFGQVSEDKKIELMRSSHVILVTSIKEGWGLIVTEAGTQGTPAVVYNVDGLRDSVKNGKTGIICRTNSPHDLASNVIKLYNQKPIYKKMREKSWESNKELTFDKSYEKLKEILSTRISGNTYL